jgi:hypothetical protein
MVEQTDRPKLPEVKRDDAPEDVREVLDRIRETLRVSVDSYIWRVFATKPRFLRAAWDELEPGVDEGFMQAADGIRGLAIERVQSSTNVEDLRDTLGDDLQQAVQELRVFLEVNPRLLILTSALKQSWQSGEVGGFREAVETERGVPRWQPEIELSPDSKSKSALREMVDLLHLPAPNSDYQALAKWPEYFNAAWQDLRSYIGTDSWKAAGLTVGWVAELAAVALPAKIRVTPDRAGDFGLSDDEVEEVGSWIGTFHSLLPGLIVNTSFLWVGLRGGTERPAIDPRELTGTIREDRNRGEGARTDTRGASDSAAGTQPA